MRSFIILPLFISPAMLLAKLLAMLLAMLLTLELRGVEFPVIPLVSWRGVALPWQISLRIPKIYSYSKSLYSPFSVLLWVNITGIAISQIQILIPVSVSMFKNYWYLYQYESSSRYSYEFSVWYGYQYGNIGGTQYFVKISRNQIKVRIKRTIESDIIFILKFCNNAKIVKR